MKNIEKSRYYGPLIHYKVELDYLKIVSWINIFLSFFIYFEQSDSSAATHIKNNTIVQF